MHTQERLEKLFFIIYWNLSKDTVPTHDGIQFDRKFTKKMEIATNKLIKVRSSSFSLALPPLTPPPHTHTHTLELRRWSWRGGHGREAFHLSALLGEQSRQQSRFPAQLGDQGWQVITHCTLHLGKPEAASRCSMARNPNWPRLLQLQRAAADGARG
jgi:hypothetical protein